MSRAVRSCARNLATRCRKAAGSGDSSASRSTSGCSGAMQHERGAVDRVDPGREHGQPLGGRGPGRRARDGQQLEIDPRALRAPDPVALHREDLVGPAIEPPDRVEQLLGVLRDAKEPLVELSCAHRRAAPPAAAIDDLLVGEHRLTALAPVHRRAPAVGQSALEHAREQPLVPAVVLGQAGRDLAVPGVADAETLELPFHVGDVLERPRLRVRVVLDRRVLRRQAERIPAERVEDVEPAHPLGARHDVANHVVAHVTDVRVPGRVREHLEAVELRPRRILRHLERARLGPARLPLALDVLGAVLRHTQGSGIQRFPQEGDGSRVVENSRETAEFSTTRDPSPSCGNLA